MNYVYPFKEGNGRSQLQYLKQLAGQAVRPLNLTKTDATGWMQTLKAAHLTRYALMTNVIDTALLKR